MKSRQDQIKEWVIAIKPLMLDIKTNIDTLSTSQLQAKVSNLYRTIKLVRSVEIGKTRIQGFNFKKLEGTNG